MQLKLILVGLTCFSALISGTQGDELGRDTTDLRVVERSVAKLPIDVTKQDITVLSDTGLVSSKNAAERKSLSPLQPAIEPSVLAVFPNATTVVGTPTNRNHSIVKLTPTSLTTPSLDKDAQFIKVLDTEGEQTELITESEESALRRRRKENGKEKGRAISRRSSDSAKLKAARARQAKLKLAKQKARAKKTKPVSLEDEDEDEESDSDSPELPTSTESMNSVEELRQSLLKYKSTTKLASKDKTKRKGRTFPDSDVPKTTVAPLPPPPPPPQDWPITTGLERKLEKIELKLDILIEGQKLTMRILKNLLKKSKSS